MITLLEIWWCSKETSSLCPSSRKDTLELVLREHNHLNFSCRHAVPFPRGQAALHLALSPMIWQTPASDRLGEVVPPLPAIFRTCFCLQLPTLPRGNSQTVVKVLENYSVLKNTSENGYIIDGPAISTTKSQLSDEARFFFDEATLVQ